MLVLCEACPEPCRRIEGPVLNLVEGSKGGRQWHRTQLKAQLRGRQIRGRETRYRRDYFYRLMLQCQFLKLVRAWRIAYTLRVRESLRGLWCNTRCCDLRLACLHPLPCGDPDHQCQPECQQSHGEVASGMRHSAHHGLLRCGMRTALFKLVKHLID